MEDREMFKKFIIFAIPSGAASEAYMVYNIIKYFVILRISIKLTPVFVISTL